MKKEDTGRKRIFVTCTFNKGSYLEYRRNLYKSVRERKTTQSKKWANTWINRLQKRISKWPVALMEMCSSSVDLKEMQVKRLSALPLHTNQNGWKKPTGKPDYTRFYKYWQECKAPRTLKYSGGSLTWKRFLKTVWENY